MDLSSWTWPFEKASMPAKPIYTHKNSEMFIQPKTRTVLLNENVTQHVSTPKMFQLNRFSISTCFSSTCFSSTCFKVKMIHSNFSKAPPTRCRDSTAFPFGALVFLCEIASRCRWTDFRDGLPGSKNGASYGGSQDAASKGWLKTTRLTVIGSV